MADETTDVPGREKGHAETVDERLDAIEEKLGLGAHSAEAKKAAKAADEEEK
jgi:hypothetical protein